MIPLVVIRVQAFVELFRLVGCFGVTEPVLLQGVSSGTDSDGAAHVLIPTVEQFATRFVVLVISEKVGHAFHHELSQTVRGDSVTVEQFQHMLVKVLFFIGFLLFFGFVFVR